MVEDKELVDEYDKLQNMKKEIEEKIENLRRTIFDFAKLKNTGILFGTHKKCSVKEFDKVVYPEDKTLLIEMIKEKGLYDKFSSINYLKLGPKILKGEVDREIIELVRKEKSFRVSLIDMGV